MVRGGDGNGRRTPLGFATAVTQSQPRRVDTDHECIDVGDQILHMAPHGVLHTGRHRDAVPDTAERYLFRSVPDARLSIPVVQRHRDPTSHGDALQYGDRHEPTVAVETHRDIVSDSDDYATAHRNTVASLVPLGDVDHLHVRFW